MSEEISAKTAEIVITDTQEESKAEKAPPKRPPNLQARGRGGRGRGRGGRGGAMAAFKQLDAANAPAGGVKANIGGGRAAGARSPSAIKETMLNWCKAATNGYKHVEIKNFSSSWNDGMAFCALVHKFDPEAFDYDKLDPSERRKNFTLAFETAEKRSDIAPLLEVDDMVKYKNPDWKCVFCYIQMFYRHYRNYDPHSGKEMDVPPTPMSPVTPMSPEVGGEEEGGDDEEEKTGEEA